MRQHYQGLDLLRGLGIFILIWMHSAFYYFDGLYELDFDNPPPIVTLIGLMLMFAGIFAMISGTAHTIQYFRKTAEQGFTSGKLLKYNTANGFIMLIVAWLYFIVTGPGLVNMAEKSMNNSLLVDLIRNGIWKGFNLERFLYVDSLVMIGINLLLIAPIFIIFTRKTRSAAKCFENNYCPFFCKDWGYAVGRCKRFRGSYCFQAPKLVSSGHVSPVHVSPGNVLPVIKDKENAQLPTATPWLIFGLMFFALSLLRIPLYEWYLGAVDRKSYGMVMLLNWFVNKNNPVMPYLSFGLLGSWMGVLLFRADWKRMVRQILPVGLVLFIAGATLYVQLPDTMLERSIDGKWFAIMTAHLGLFLLIVLAALRLFDFRKSGPVRRLHAGLAFINRFGVAGLTAFFFESVVSAVIFRVFRLFWPDLSLNLPGSLLYGFSLALLWGFLLMLWEKHHYKYGIEYVICRLMTPFGHSAKQDKLEQAGVMERVGVMEQTGFAEQAGLSKQKDMARERVKLDTEERP